MAYLSRAFAPVLVLALATGGIAQVKAPRSAVAAQAAPAVKVDPTAWLYKGSHLPHDPAWVFGTLPNGLRYAVRKNGVPPGQVSIRVRIDAGSLNEKDSERGYAHFIEHLSFRGSEYVPDGEAKRGVAAVRRDLWVGQQCLDHADADALQARPAIRDRADGR